MRGRAVQYRVDPCAPLQPRSTRGVSRCMRTQPTTITIALAAGLAGLGLLNTPPSVASVQPATAGARQATPATGETRGQRLTREAVERYEAAVKAITPSPHASLGLGERAQLQATITLNVSKQFNDQIATIPEADRAWPVMLKVVARLKQDPWLQAAYSPRECQEFLNVQLETGSDEDWTPEQRWAAVKAALAKHTETLALIREMASKPRLGMPVRGVMDHDLMRAMAEARPEYQPRPEEFEEYPENPPAIALLLPHLQHTRQCARLLKADCFVALEEGDFPRIIANLKALDGLANLSAENGFLIGQLVELAISALRAGVVNEMLAFHGSQLDPRQLASLADTLGPVSNGVAEPLDFSGERLGFVDALQRMFSDDGAGNGVMVSSASRTLAEYSGMSGAAESALDLAGAILFAADRATEQLTYDSMIGLSLAQAALPQWERGSTDDFFEKVVQPRRTGQSRLILCGLLLPALDKATQSGDRAGQSLDGVRVAVALHRFKLAKGAWPESLDALVPAYLASVPVDRWTGGPVLYAIKDTGPVVYSVGYDKNDDGGRAPAESPSSAGQWTALDPSASVAQSPGKFDGDFVLYPPVE